MILFLGIWFGVGALASSTIYLLEARHHKKLFWFDRADPEDKYILLAILLAPPIMLLLIGIACAAEYIHAHRKRKNALQKHIHNTVLLNYAGWYDVE